MRSLTRRSTIQAMWNNHAYRLYRISRIYRGPKAPEHAVQCADRLRRPDVQQKARAAHKASVARAMAHQDRMVADLAREAGVGPEMRDVTLMRSWVENGVRMETIARWLGVHQSNVWYWIRRGVTPRRSKS